MKTNFKVNIESDADKIEAQYPGGVSSALPPLQTSELWNDFHAAMETPQSFDELQSPHVPPPLLRNVFEGGSLGRDGTRPSNI